MKKVYLLLTAICLAALTGCVKEEPYTLETATLEVNLTRGEGDANFGPQHQGNGIKDVMIWAFQVSESGTVTDKAVGWRQVSDVNTYQSVAVDVPLPVCNDQQWYMLVAVINTAEFGTATFSSSTTYSQLKTMTFDASSRDFWKSYPNDSALTPEDMPVSNWAKFLLKSTNTHANNQCYTLNMPVYRAVAKTQLFVSKKSNDFALEITGASVHAGSAPTKGFVLSATAENRTGANGEAAQIGNPTLATEGVVIPTWYSSFVTADMTLFLKQLRNTSAKSDETTTYSFSSVSLPKPTEEGPNPQSEDVWAGSLFLYENAADGRVADYANYDYKTNPASKTDYNNHYYLAVDYKIDGAQQPTGYVPLPAVVRNHDYNVDLTVDAGGELTLKIDVLDWTEQTAQLDFKDYVTFSKSITWAEGTNVDSNNNHIVQLGNAQGVAASFSFQLNAPVGGTWYAELITKQGKANAFSFSNTAVQATTSGDIGTEANLTIYTTAENFGAETENVAELRITARGTIGGVTRTFRVDMDNYQIKQAN